jgi:uncharacterized protein (TIGR03382 family)
LRFAIKENASSIGNRKSAIPMSMSRANRRSGLAFLLVGVVGVAFFWLTDPRLGPAMHRSAAGRFDWRHWLFVVRGSPDHLLGVAGSLTLLLLGLWLLTRRRL